jgi:hypothetical protein
VILSDVSLGVRLGLRMDVPAVVRHFDDYRETIGKEKQTIAK